MTRRSKREIERAIEGVESEEGGQGRMLVAHRDPRTDDLTDRDGEPVTGDQPDTTGWFNVPSPTVAPADAEDGP